MDIMFEEQPMLVGEDSSGRGEARPPTGGSPVADAAETGDAHDRGARPGLPLPAVPHTSCSSMPLDWECRVCGCERGAEFKPALMST